MIDKDVVAKAIRDFKAKHGVQDLDEHLVTTLHLMNAHRLDLAASQDQTSHGANDKGIDGWFYDAKSFALHIYQSKLSASKGLVLKACDGLTDASTWLEAVISSGEVEGKITNSALYNLAKCLGQYRHDIKFVKLYILSLFDPNELLDLSDLEECKRTLVKSTLNKLLTERGGGISIQPEAYKLTEILPSAYSTYELTSLPDTVLKLGKRTHLQTLYLHLNSLVELYRRRGNRLFEKNVRLYLNSKESRVRLEHPLEDTLDRICTGSLDPGIFPFYHIGVTLIAGDCQSHSGGQCSLEMPNIINGCQTVNIADRYLKKLEKEKAADKIARFKEIPVLAKIVIAATDDQVREISNSNNRQNPIESWQLFSNEPVHVLIEESFRDMGFFYERQKGKFDADMKSTDNLNVYSHTNNTKVTVEDLGQLIALCRRRLQLSAKPSDIFADKQTHDSVFDSKIPNFVRDAVWSFNALKAVKKGLKNYLEMPTHSNEMTQRVFSKPLLKQSLYYAAMMHLYQKCPHLLSKYATQLNKKSPSNLADEAEAFYRKIISKTKTWYWNQSQQNTVEVSWKKLEEFLEDELCHASGLDPSGDMPFTRDDLAWNEFLSSDDGR